MPSATLRSATTAINDTEAAYPREALETAARGIINDPQTPVSLKAAAGCCLSDYLDGHHPISCSVWAWSACDAADIDAASRGGAIAQAARKGWITAAPYDENDATATLTPAGARAILDHANQQASSPAAAKASPPTPDESWICSTPILCQSGYRPRAIVLHRAQAGSPDPLVVHTAFQMENGAWGYENGSYHRDQQQALTVFQERAKSFNHRCASDYGEVFPGKPLVTPTLMAVNALRQAAKDLDAAANLLANDHAATAAACTTRAMECRAALRHLDPTANDG